MKHHFLISFMILTFATCTLTGCGAKEIHQVSVIDEKYVHPIGRTLAEKKDNQDMLYFANSCSGFAFQATSNGISIKFYFLCFGCYVFFKNKIIFINF